MYVLSIPLILDRYPPFYTFISFHTPTLIVGRRRSLYSQ